MVVGGDHIQFQRQPRHTRLKRPTGTLRRARGGVVNGK
jgi:hypothetical protein